MNTHAHACNNACNGSQEKATTKVEKGELFM